MLNVISEKEGSIMENKLRTWDKSVAKFEFTGRILDVSCDYPTDLYCSQLSLVYNCYLPV